MNRYRKSGFTLLEMLLVIAIAASIITMVTSYLTQKSSQAQRDKVVVQMQQILDAGLAYYNMNGTWPITGFSTTAGSTYTRVALDPAGSGTPNGKALFTSNYLPSAKSFYINPLGLGTGCDPKYYIDFNATTGVFGVIATLCGPSSQANATIIAGQLPSGFITSSLPAATGGAAVPTYSACTAGSTCYVEGQVNMPGQNLNNARSVNLAGVYHNGACVPAPACPNGFTPSIVVAVTQAGGYADPTDHTKMFPIESFAAYAYGAPTALTPDPNPVLPDAPADCFNIHTATPCAATMNPSTQTISAAGGSAAVQKYWRVCLIIQTNQGQVNANNYSLWAKDSMIMAITRCTPATENGGSDFSVYTQ